MGCAFDTTRLARTSEPSESSTPTERPLPAMATRCTSAPVRISAPADSAARAMALETPPMPPRTQPQAPACPATSPIQWCISTYAEPGDIGPHHAPITACVASAPFTRSSSNHSSRKSAALIVNSRTISCTSRPVQLRILPAVRTHRAISRMRTFGGTTNRRSFNSPATRSK